MDLRRVDLNLLVAFDMLMTERSVTLAARRLSVGQSAMSSTLARLRKLFNDPILIREGQALVATPLAESLAQPVRDLLNGIEDVLTPQDRFDPATAERTFTLFANDYLAMTFLQPFIARLSAEAPGVRLRIFPTGDDAPDRLRKNEVDLLIMPREAVEGRVDFPYQPLYRDRYVVALDRGHPDVGDTITLEQFSTLPYVAAVPGRLRSIQEMQLDFLGIDRNVELTVGFTSAPFLLRGTRLITLIHETVGKRFEDAAGIRLLDPPIPRLQPITLIMGWTKRTDMDAGHRWLREAIASLAAGFGIQVPALGDGRLRLRHVTTPTTMLGCAYLDAGNPMSAYRLIASISRCGALGQGPRSPEVWAVPTSSSPAIDLNRVDLNLLVAFDALMAERSVSAAAARLSVGQSAMSSTLARLRRLLNDPVLVREGRSMVATPVAESLAVPVRETLDGIQALLSVRRDFDPAVDQRTFTVKASDYAVMVVLQPLLAYLTAQAWEVGLRIVPMSSNPVEQLARGQDDLLIVPRAAFHDRDDLCTEPLYTDRYMLAADADNAEVGDTVTPAQFSTLPYLSTHFDLRPSLPEIELDLLGISRRVEATAGIVTAPFLLRGTRLVTFVPELVGRRIGPAAGLRLIEPPVPLRPLAETMVWMRRFDDDPGHAWMRRRLHVLADAVSEGSARTLAAAALAETRVARRAAVLAAAACIDAINTSPSLLIV